MIRRSNKYIELFAGCGGLSVGLEAVGFELLFANEISPMAGETFAFNILNEDLNHKSNINETSEKVLWISSQYERNNLKARLREKPALALNGEFTELNNNLFLNDKKLLVGDINRLINIIKNDNAVLNNLRDLDVDLVSGGPPCQSFSLAGLREKSNYRNTLPHSFAEFVGLVKPKMVLLENVEGITLPFKDGKKYYYAWLEVSKAFALEEYYTVCMLVNSKYFEIPQNRPRFVLLGFREDVFENLKINCSDSESKEVLKISENFRSLCLSSKRDIDEITINDFKYFDIEKASDEKYFNGNILPQLVKDKFKSVSEVLDDIKSIKEEYNLKELSKGFIRHLNSIFNHHDETYLENHYLKNHEPRKHNKIVQSRFRLYQLLSKLENGYKKTVIDAIKGDEINAKVLLNLFKDHKIYFEGKRKYLKSEEEIIKYFNKIKSKKQAQRALIANLPSPAQLTIPDDVCHYDKNQLRTLTVREMARIQTFPDWFVFRSKITTGGKLRKFEVPQYTQVGNAVPPLLAYKLGLLINKILSK